MSNTNKLEQAARFRKYAKDALETDTSMAHIIGWATSDDWDVFYNVCGRYSHTVQEDYNNVMCLYCLFIAEYLEGE